jgi:hypothetical protein
MALITQKVRNITAGVSQIPAANRPSGFADILENALVTLTKGVRKRPPTTQVATLDSSIPSSYAAGFIHAVDRTLTERYLVCVVNNTLKIFDAITGAAQTLITPSGSAYLSSAANGFRAFTVGDYTFLTNRSKVVKRGTKTAPTPAYEALLFVRQSDFSTPYTITLDSNVVTYRTVDMAHATSRYQIATSNVAADIITTLTANQQINGDFNFTQYGSTIYVARKDARDFTVSAKDGLSDKGLRVVKNTVQYKEDLPERAKAGMIVRVSGDPGTNKDDFWVKYEDSGYGDQAGVWRETAAPGVPTNFDKTTMPWAIIRKGPIFGPQVQNAYPNLPKITRGGTTTYTDGFTLDPDTGTAYSGDVDVFITDHSKRFRTAALTGVAGTQRTVKAYYDVDTTLVEAGQMVEVRLSIDPTGAAGFSTVASKYYNPGRMIEDEYFETIQTLSAGAKVEVGLYYSSTVTPTTYRKARVTLHRSGHPRQPGLRNITTDTQDVTFVATDKYPAGCVITLNLDSGANIVNYTVGSGADETGATVATGLNALVNPLANYNSTNPSSGVVRVQRVSANNVSVVASLSATEFTNKFWKDSLTMTPGEHVGRIIRNLTDGSTGSITSNTATTIITSGLSGGIDNTFQAGDKIQVETTGTYFVLTPLDWGERGAGSLDTDPMPSFCDQTINEVFYTQDRLGFLSGENIILSGAGDIFRFWRRTATDLLADDPIDIASAHKDVTIFDGAVSWDNGVLLSSESGHQFKLHSPSSALTPTTVRLDHIGSFPASSAVRPITHGSRVVLLSASSSYTQAQELYYDDTTGKLAGQVLTEHVPSYLSGTPKAIVVDARLGFMAVLTSGSDLYVHNFKLQGTDKAQMAWSKWIFPNTTQIVGMDMAGGKLALMIRRPAPSDAIYLETIDVANPPASNSDHRDRQTSGSLTTYLFKWRLSRLYLRSQNDEPDVTAKLVLRYLKVYYADSMDCTVTVTPPSPWSATTSTVSFGGGTDGVLSSPVMQKNDNGTVIEITSNSTGGIGIVGLEWEGFITQRSQRV